MIAELQTGCNLIKSTPTRFFVTFHFQPCQHLSYKRENTAALILTFMLCIKTVLTYICTYIIWNLAINV